MIGPKFKILIIFISLLTCVSIASGRALENQAGKNPEDAESVSSLRSIWRIQTENIDATFTNMGIWGAEYVTFSECDDDTCPSFVTPPGSGHDYLYAGALWFGCVRETDTLVSTGADGWFSYMFEFAPTAPAYSIDDAYYKYVWTVCADTLPTDWPFDSYYQHTPINIRVTTNVLGFDANPTDNAIIYDMVVTNIGEETINEGYLGIFMDADADDPTSIQDYRDDIAGSIREEGIVYVIDNDGDPNVGGYFDSASVTKIFAVRLLDCSFEAADTSFNWWISNGNPYLDFGPRQSDEFGDPYCPFGSDTIRSGSPVSDPLRYCLLSNGEWDYDLIRMSDSMPGWEPVRPEVLTEYAEGGDVKFLLSLGPISLAPGASERIMFATITGDSVHTVVDNLENLASDPDLYLANLDFSDVIANGRTADSIVDNFIKYYPIITGLHVTGNSPDSVVIEWDPWCYPDVLGYEIYLSRVPDDFLIFPNALPPYMSYKLPLFTTVGDTYRHTLSNLEPHRYYFASIAPLFSGHYGQEINFLAGGKIPAPEMAAPYVFHQDGQPAVINWSGPSDITVGHYNIYKFPNREASEALYYPFYDQSNNADGLTPIESVLVVDDYSYYYSMQPYAQVAGEFTEFSEIPADSTVYIVTAVDTAGYESLFSTGTTVYTALERSRDILVVSWAKTTIGFTTFDSLQAFYDSVLQGYDYAVFNLADSTFIGELYERQLWWDDLLPYKMVIIEDPDRASIISDIDLIGGNDIFSKYIWSGGTLVYSGIFELLTTYNPFIEPDYYPVDHWFVKDYFGIDSIFHQGLQYYVNSPGDPPPPDTNIGCIEAAGVADTIPSLHYNIWENPIVPYVFWFWDSTVVPCPAAFIPDDRGQITHRLVSKYPETSLVHNDPVGIKTETDLWTTYLFGVHFWYMYHEDARALIDFMMARIPTDVEEEAPALPLQFSLGQNYPNPFNTGTTIPITLAGRAQVRCEIFNVLGQKVRTLIDGPMNGGIWNIQWDGKDAFGKTVPSGVYFYRLEAGDFSASRKMILLK